MITEEKLSFTLAEAGRQMVRRDSMGVYRHCTEEEMVAFAASGLLTTYLQCGERRTTLLDLRLFGIEFGLRVVTTTK